MSKAFLIAIFILLLFGACRSEPDSLVVNPPAAPEPERGPVPYTITDYENKSRGGAIPEWVSLWLDSGVYMVENMDAYRDRYVFVARNEANNFNALNLWRDGFSAELDFPRLAAARVEKRLAAAVENPDQNYGAFYETMIRTASDFSWTGAVRVDDFWTLRQFPPGDEGVPDENWEFLILVTIEKSLFASQLNRVFEMVNPAPPPSRDQRTTINRVRERFFDGF
jgi:hypothetical protein